MHIVRYVLDQAFFVWRRREEEGRREEGLVRREMIKGRIKNR